MGENVKMNDWLYKMYSLKEEDYHQYAGPYTILDLELLVEILKNKKTQFVGLDNEKYYMVDHWICKSIGDGLIMVDDALDFWWNNPVARELIIPDGIYDISETLVDRWEKIYKFYIDGRSNISEMDKYLFEKVYIGANLKSNAILSLIMSLCTELDISNKNEYYKIIDGCVIEMESNRLISCINSRETLSIPNDVKSIATYSINNKEYKTIIFPKNGVFVKSKGIINCNKLTTIISEGKIEVEDDSIILCKGLEEKYKDEIEIILGTSYIKRRVSEECISVPRGIRYICKHAFAGKDMQIVFLPSTIEKIDKGIFNACTNLKGVILEEGTSKASAISIIDNYSKVYGLSGELGFQKIPGEYSIYIPDNIYDLVVLEKGSEIVHCWEAGSYYERSWYSGKTTIQVKRLSEWVVMRIADIDNNLNKLTKLKKHISELYLEHIFECKKLETQTDLEFMLQKKWDYTKINLHGWILDSKICEGLNRLGWKDYLIEQLESKLEELLILGYDCSAYISGLKIYKRMDKIESLYDELIEYEMRLLYKINMEFYKFISKSINMSMSFEKRIENEINNDGFVNINAWHLVINVYLIKMKEEGLIEKEMYEQILCMINEIKNYCCFGYPSTPEEFLYDY